MTFENVTPKNALLYALKAYDNPQCLSVEEFTEDYKRFKYVKRLCRRYLTTGVMSDRCGRLLLNHLVLLNNVFGPEPTVRLLFLKCETPRMYRVLKPFLLYLGILPRVVTGVNGEDIHTDGIPTDEQLLTQLRAL